MGSPENIEQVILIASILPAGGSSPDILHVDCYFFHAVRQSLNVIMRVYAIPGCKVQNRVAVVVTCFKVVHFREFCNLPGRDKILPGGLDKIKISCHCAAPP